MGEKDADRKKDLEALLTETNKLANSVSDPGPVYDCVVFHDGQHWRAVVDTSETGDLASCGKPMADYKVEYQYRPFSVEDLMNFSVNIFNDGNVLSIVATAGTHGTHVAGIVGANFPDQPELNGIAPGCQMISVKIGDSRLGSMETGQGLIRGLCHVLKSGCHLINMSYGEPATECDKGRFSELATELVNKHGVIFVSSAGNAGPALSTVGAPGGTTEAVISVGAYVSPAMMEMEYSMHTLLPETQYTWSSRGPSVNGGQGVTISAPGGAISPVPNYTLQRNQLMNGTSMASPSACGTVALLLSGLVQKKQAYSPQRIRRALENSSRPVQGVEQLALGCGLVQVNRCFDYLQAFYSYADQDVDFKVKVNGGRGIYLRERADVESVHVYSVGVNPQFRDEEDVTFIGGAVLDESALAVRREKLHRDKVAFEMRVNLSTTAEWIDVPKHLLLNNGGRTFSIRVDTRSLAPGVYFAEVSLIHQFPTILYLSVLNYFCFICYVFKDVKFKNGITINVMSLVSICFYVLFLSVDGCVRFMVLMPVRFSAEPCSASR